MSTRSLIGKYEGGRIKAIYCHFDGYPSGVGEMLKENYTSEDKINKLLSLGDISFLEKEVEPKEGQEHSFDHKAEGVTVAYHRDRGEDLVIRHFSDENEYMKDSGIDYYYLWKGKSWHISNGIHEFINF